MHCRYLWLREGSHVAFRATISIECCPYIQFTSFAGAIRTNPPHWGTHKPDGSAAKTNLAIKWAQPISFLLKKSTAQGGLLGPSLTTFIPPKFARRGSEKTPLPNYTRGTHTSTLSILSSRTSWASSAPYTLLALGP